MTLAFWRSRQARRRSSVPGSWQTSQSVAADLHRRMHLAVTHTRRTLEDARRCGTSTDRFDVLCDDLETAAAVIDDQLVHASRLPIDPRQKALRELRYRIVELERTGDRIGRTALEATSPLTGGVDAALRAINQRLDLTIEARTELRELEP
jgi:hypothetical protein